MANPVWGRQRPEGEEDTVEGQRQNRRSQVTG